MRAKPLVAFLALAAFALPIAGAPSNASEQVPRQQVRDRITLRDGPGDVWKYTFLTRKWSLEGQVPTADILRFRARHGHTNIRIVMVFNDLKRAGKSTPEYWVDIQTPKMWRTALIDVWPGAWSGRHSLSTYGGDLVSCRGMTHKIDYAKDTVSLVVPRALLGQPRWVRVREWNEFWPPEADTTYLQDNPSTDRPHGSFTVRLYRS